MRFGLIILILLCLTVSATPQERRVGGTFIGAIVAADGIVIGSDSRSTFIEENGRAVGYIDGSQKIFAGSGSAVAVSGLTSVDGEMFGTFVDHNSFLLDRSADEVLFGFAVWLPFKNSTGVMLLSAGFRDGKPMICGRTVSHPQACQDTGLITNKRSPSLETWINAQKVAPTAAAAAAALKQAIHESAAQDVTVGGGVSLGQLRPGAPLIWLENSFSGNWKTVCDLVRDYRNGRARIVPTNSNQEFTRYLNTSCR
jgi:hypothetical protein